MILPPKKKIREKIYLDGQNLAAIINNTSDLIWSVDETFHIITGNDAFWRRVAELTGKSADTVTNADFEPQLLERYIAHYRVAFTGKNFRTVRERTDARGVIIYEQLSFNPIYDLQEKAIGVNCFLRDITEQQQHLQRIERQNERLREIAWIQSHRVRAPLANILGLTQLISLPDSTDAEIIGKLKKAAEDLDKVIRDITVLTDDLIEPGGPEDTV